jgi:hypothetical protein
MELRAENTDLNCIKKVAGMKKFSRLTLVSAVCFFCGCVAAQGDKADSAGGRIMVMDGSRLQAGFDMGVDSQNRDHGWLARENGYFRMDYPGGRSGNQNRSRGHSGTFRFAKFFRSI